VEKRMPGILEAITDTTAPHPSPLPQGEREQNSSATSATG
jgi:hypothetical protein